MTIKRIIKNFIVLSLMILSIGATAFGVSSYVNSTAYACDLEKSVLGIPTWYKYLEGVEDSTGRCSPELSGNDEKEKINSTLPIGLAVLEALIRLAGIVAVVMVFFGGFKFITSQGNPDAAAGARKTIINALVGLVIVVLSTTIISFIGNSLI